jgi:hypothetical protein
MIDLVRPCYAFQAWCNPDDDRHPGYYFWDEAGMECYGPYETEEQCQAGLVEYALSLEPRNG